MTRKPASVSPNPADTRRKIATTANACGNAERISAAC
jgi:hypothetical protein